MKNFSKLMILALMLINFNNINAQEAAAADDSSKAKVSALDEDRIWQVTFGANAVDLFPVGEDDDFPLRGAFFDEFMNVEDHWNILPSLSTVSVSRYITKGFSFGASFAINEIEVLGQDANNNEVTVNDVTGGAKQDFSYYSIDGTIKYSLANLIKAGSLEPYVGVGGGYTWVNEIGAGTFNGTLGLNYWINESIGITAQSSYKHAFKDYGTPHFQHVAGLSIRFGGKDADKDKIFDRDDKCPEVAGLEAFGGCPDTDLDGVQDSEDACPEVAGLGALAGCPDQDGDGIADKDDKCVAEAGLDTLAGCPDDDGDGVANGDDECADVVGALDNKGCPWPDTDADGVLDKDDKCADVAGTVAGEGCPEAPAELIKKLEEYSNIILFDTGRSSIRKQAEGMLKGISALLKEYPTAKFTLEGHTDNVGKEANNLKLGEQRAVIVRQYLVENGIEPGRLRILSYGESKPVDNNDTPKGRSKNRRCEILLEK